MLRIGRIVIMKESEYKGLVNDKDLYYGLYRKKSNEVSNLRLTQNVKDIASGINA